MERYRFNVGEGAEIDWKHRIDSTAEEGDNKEALAVAEVEVADETLKLWSDFHHSNLGEAHATSTIY